MESPDIVDTSDVDEREDFDVSEDAGHSVSLPTSTDRCRVDVLASPQRTTSEKAHQPRPDSLFTLITRHDRPSYHEIESPSPRKRIKVAHNAGSVSPGSAYPVTAETPLLNYNRPNVVSMQTIPESSLQYSSQGVITGDGHELPSVSSPLGDLSPRSDLRSLFSSPSSPSVEHDALDATSRVASQSVELSSTCRPFPHSHPRSISTSTCRHSLFSSPLRRPTTPPQTSSRCSPGLSSPGIRKLHSVASSPLTPVSSPALLARMSSSSPDPLQLIFLCRPEPQHPPEPRSSPPPAILPRVQSPPMEIPEDPQPLGRYSFRRREARQLNPYAYDKLLYKQQLKSHPDAIVKFRSPHRRLDSGGVAEDGTQDEFVLPFDNPDEDGDYMNVESGRRGRRQGQNLDQHDVSKGNVRGLDTRQSKDGWLPETLRGLSSSDEDDNEIRKLARKIRKEREKAEVLARAEVIKAAAKARRIEREHRRTTKRGPKPFPIHRDVERMSTHSEPSPSPSLNFRACSEPATTAHLPSPSRSHFRPSVLLRASSHSPAASSNPLRTYDFSICMEQEDSYRFDDNEIPFLRNHPPVELSVTHSGPPTTSGASALLSNASGGDSDSDQPSILEMSSKDRKRLRAWKHMVPTLMISRQLATTENARHPPPRSRATVESSGSEAEEVRVIPGLAVVRKGRYRDVEVKGDPESSDLERSEVHDGEGNGGTGGGAMELFSDGESAVRVRRVRPASPMLKYEDDVISLSSGSMQGSSSEDSEDGSQEDEQAHQSLFDRPARGPAREKSLIDWMLTRTRGPSGPKPRSKQPASSRRSHGSGVSRLRLDIITSGTRRYGGHHQTRLPFVKANTSSNTTSLTKHTSEHWERSELDQDTIEENEKRRKKGKRQSRTNQGPVYNVHHDATRIASRYRTSKSNRGKAALVVEHDDNEFRRALDPGWRAEVERWNRPISPARQPVVKSPAAPRPRVYRRAFPQPQNELALPFYFQREEGTLEAVHHHIVVDMNITPLPSGIKFATSSYIGRGLLYQLVAAVSGNSETSPPTPCSMQGLEIGPTTSAAVFSALLGPLRDRLTDALYESRADDVDTVKEWESVTRASSQLISWLAVHAEDQDFSTLEVALREHSDGLLLVLEPLETSVFSLTAHWFIVELSARLAAGIKYRRGPMENGYLIRSAKQLMQRLLGVDLQPSFATFYTAEGDVDVTPLSHRATELWVCLVHLLPSFDASMEVAASGHPLWRLLADLHPESSPTGAEASEEMWRTIFSLCAISQFSVHGLSTSVFRLPAAWELVAATLKKIVLTSDSAKERLLPQRALRKRDDYVSCVVSRCFLLWSQWGWRLDDGVVMFKSLQEIFRSRNFANLLSERSAPMGFLEHGDLELLSKRDPHDSAFERFLKMVVQAVNLLNANVELDAKQRSTHIKKLLQMAVPVSPVPFSRSVPPSAHSLSMLVNRFSAMVIAVHLDPTSTNVKFRINQARRCVGFKDADDHSRMVCIYGMMNFAMIARHHKIVGGLEEVLGWLGEMADALMDEYKEGEAGSVGKKPTITLIQLLIGSVRRVIETQSLDKGQSRAEYPDPAFLNGSWITRVLNPRTDLATIQQTGVEIRMLVQSFLDARLKALPEVQPPPPPVVHSAESQESQDEYDKMFLDLKDEELLAALGDEAEASIVADLKFKEGALCKVLDKSITPAVYRLICKHFSESERTKSDATSNTAADEWIDCWVGCANVLVQNNYKDWGLYMKLGQQSWEKIIDDSWRRRVGLRFNLMLLRLDPGAYNKMKDDFIAVLLVASLSRKTTIEHEFISVVLSLDGLQHPLLRGSPFDPIPGTRKYEVGEGDYEVARGRLIETVFTNAAGCLRAGVDAESRTYAEMVVVMLSTMRDIYQSAEDRAEYGEFCRRVFHMLSSHPELVSHPRLSDAVGFWRSV